MFDRDRAIDDWTHMAYAGPCREKAASREELADHLLCEMERLESEGRTPEEAFRLATAKLAGNGELFAPDRLSRSLRRGRLVNSVIWAAVFIGTALLLSGTVSRDTLSYLLLFVLLPCWYASDLLLARYLRVDAER